MLGNLVVVPHAGSIDSLSRQTSSFRVSSIRLGARATYSRRGHDSKDQRIGHLKGSAERRFDCKLVGKSSCRRAEKSEVERREKAANA